MGSKCSCEEGLVWGSQPPPIHGGSGIPVQPWVRDGSQPSDSRNRSGPLLAERGLAAPELAQTTKVADDAAVLPDNTVRGGGAVPCPLPNNAEVPQTAGSTAPQAREHIEPRQSLQRSTPKWTVTGHIGMGWDEGRRRRKGRGGRQSDCPLRLA